VGDVYRQVRALAARGDTPVLFSGTPCQVAALTTLLSPDQRQQVLLVDFLCHGVPSLTLFHRYLRELHGGEPISAYTFRDRTYGPQTIRAESVGGRRSYARVNGDAFMQGFCVFHAFLQRACHACPFRGGSRVSDVTLADYWGAPREYAHLGGISVACANTPAGLEALTRLGATGATILKPLAAYPRATARRVWSVSVRRPGVMRDIAAGRTFAQIVATHYPHFRRFARLAGIRKAYGPARWPTIASAVIRKVRRAVGGTGE
jgi:hypothetical protein